MRKRLLSVLLLLAMLAGLFGSPQAHIAWKGQDPDPETLQELEAALQDAVRAGQENVLAFLVYETGLERVVLSEDGQTAVIWIHSTDRSTGEVTAAEPGLAIARLVAGQWLVYLQSNPQWRTEFESMPEGLLSAAEMQYWQDALLGSCSTQGLGTFGGYYLPWQAGASLVLTGSISHSCPNYNCTLGPPDQSSSMFYAFDFSTSPSALFNLYAAKSGTVQFFWDGQGNGDPNSPGNYIVLEDNSTTPATYQLYLHLAQNSIPPALKVSGAPVARGDFIGIADDTGASTNHHLHFQVHTVPTSYWGCSIDVTFRDVPINWDPATQGGRPRTVAEASSFPQYGAQGQTFFISGNTPSGDSAPPSAGLFTPIIGQSVTQSIVLLDGWALDPGSGVAQSQFKVNYDGQWQSIGPVFLGSNLFNTTWDMCASAVPDGPVLAGVFAIDNEGNQVTVTGAVPFVKDHDCAPQPPACSPDVDEIALFERPDYQGACTTLPVGSYLLSTGMGATAARVDSESTQTGTQVGSVLVGAGGAAQVSVTLYKDVFSGRGQTFDDDDANLADDWVGAGIISLADVRLTTSAPWSPIPIWPNGGTLPENASVSLVWDDGGGALEFQARLTGPGGTITSTWSPDSFWAAGSLTDGIYTWEVRARNAAAESGWAAGAFTVLNDPGGPPSAQAVPITEGFESGANGWTGEGYWNVLSDATVAHLSSKAWWYGTPAGNYSNGTYDDGSPNGGDLTSPPINIPSSGTYYLRFWSRYLTETSGDEWDQRWLQISSNGGPYLNVYQLHDEVADAWRKSPYFDLSAYKGEAIRIRFHFETLDARNNVYKGWLIDDVTIDTTAPPGCGGNNEPDGDPALATPIGFGGSQIAEICPAGDIDYFSFSANAGDTVGINLDAKINGSLLDGWVFLFDEDGDSLMAENDDQIPGTGGLLDSLVHYTVQRSGTYFIRLRAWDHPAVGSNSYSYTLRLFNDSDDPQITAFTSSAVLTDTNNVPAQVSLSLSAGDSSSGIGEVLFLFHSGDWNNDPWSRLALDSNGLDGWSAVWDTTVFPPEFGMALVAIVFDRAGNIEVIGMWNLFTGVERVYLPVIQR